MSFRFLAAALLACAALAARAELVIAQVGPLSGPLAINGMANFLGSKACFDQVNAEGGIHGQQIRFVGADDEYKAEQTIRLLETVAQRDRPLMFVNLLGSANVTALMKAQTLDRLKVPVVGVTPGADSLREPGSPWLFHVHASDNAQVLRILNHLATLGIRRIAVAYQDIPFGQTGMKFIDAEAPGLQLTITARVPVPSAADDLKPAAAQLKAAGAQAYVMILVPNSGASLARDVRGTGDSTPLYGLSYVPVGAIVEKAGADAAVGIALAQVTPNPSSRTTGLTRQFHAAMDKYAPKDTPHSQLHLVGYLSARVAVEALRRAGPNPTPEKMAATLRQLRVELGGYTVDFAGGNVGSQFVDIGVIDRSHRLMY